MTIAAWSDGHGSLPNLEKHVDVLLIAGDLIDLYIQRNTEKSLNWFLEKFLNYVANVDADKVIFTPGNHDFLFERISKDEIKDHVAKDPLVKDKLVCLIDESYQYGGVNFYGCPWCTGPYNWAFSPSDTNQDVHRFYDVIPDETDVLITHQPPKVDKVGCSFPYMAYEREFGSDHLRDVLDNRHISLCVCGHIHSGIHGGVPYGDTMVYNVSIKNEDYVDVYDVTYIEIDPKSAS